MIFYERQQKVMEILVEKQSATVECLCKKLFASGATIRRDLEKMEQNGLLKRVRGGAVLLKGSGQDAPILLRSSVNKDKKEIIAGLALRLLRSGDTCFFDSSSTVSCLAKRLEEKREITVITNGIATLNILSELSEVDTICTGGRLRGRSSFVGENAISTVKSLFADIAFISCCGIFSDFVTEALEENATIKRAMLANAKQKVLLCDSSKFGASFLSITCRLSGVDTIITDKKPDNEFLESIKCRVIF